MVRVPDAKSDCSRQGLAAVPLLNFKTTWSEFQKPSKSDCSRRGKAGVCILNFKTTWSEFQKSSQTAAERGEAELRILELKTTWSEFQMPSQTAPAEVKPKYVYSILKPHGQSSRCQVRLLRPRRSRGAYTQF